MNAMNLYLCGVGGPGIGLLAEVMAQAALTAGYPVRGSDTHGLAQRHGTVVSHLRLGDALFAPRVPPGRADLVIGLERLETLRGVLKMLRPGGAVAYYDTTYQPIFVRMGEAAYPTHEELAAAVAARGGTLERVHLDDLADMRMQNAALLGRLGAIGAVPGVTVAVLETALREAVPPAAWEKNLAVFRRGAGAA
jgi:indolepyruvate ferredoxin oxidoreductase beta subunit